MIVFPLRRLFGSRAASASSRVATSPTFVRSRPSRTRWTTALSCTGSDSTTKSIARPPVLAAYARQPFDIPTEVPLITDPLAHRVADLANVAYELVLHLLTRFFTHTDETDEQLEVLIGTAIELMGTVIRPLGTALTQLPVGPPHEGRSAGFAFEMYYLMGNFVPWREPAWALLHERSATLVDGCVAAADQHGQLGALADAGSRMQVITAKLSAHVPEELLGVRAP